jgi:2-keto-4-pentenoate hydratase/2-oxohepta-3-ene-1,7-dioic acid hydratase in catechol pathway
MVGENERLVVERDGALRVASEPGVTLVDVMHDPELVDSEAAGEAIEPAALVAPLRPGKVVAIGLNYRDHVR